MFFHSSWLKNYIENKEQLDLKEPRFAICYLLFASVPWCNPDVTWCSPDVHASSPDVHVSNPDVHASNSDVLEPLPLRRRPPSISRHPFPRPLWQRPPRLWQRPPPLWQRPAPDSVTKTEDFWPPGETTEGVYEEASNTPKDPRRGRRIHSFNIRRCVRVT